MSRYETTTTVVASPVLPPGYAVVNGVVKGPPVEPGYSGAVPPPQGSGQGRGVLVQPPPQATVKLQKVVTTRDLLSGHTVVKREPWVSPDDPDTEEGRAEAKARERALSGGTAVVGRPVVTENDPNEPQDEEPAPAPRKRVSVPPKTETLT